MKQQIKSLKTLSIVTGSISAVYAVFSIITGILALSTITELAQLDTDAIDPDNIDAILGSQAFGTAAMLTILWIIAGGIAIALFVLGIITIVKSTKLTTNVNGKTVALIASIMCTAGFASAWIISFIPFANVVYVVAQSVLYFIAASQLGKNDTLVEQPNMMTFE